MCIRDRQKARELSLILEAYDALVAQSYVDPLDDLTRLKALLEQHALFKGCVVALDSFQSFTVQEYQIIAAMLEQADEVYVSLCTDQLDDPERGMGLFSLVRHTGNTLIPVSYTHLADANKAFALIELRVTPKRDRGFDEIAQKIMQFEEVDSVYLMSGGFDLAVMVHGLSLIHI